MAAAPCELRHAFIRKIPDRPTEWQASVTRSLRRNVSAQVVRGWIPK
jgi:hypothetical protein